jgi:hypothetical protein
MTAVPASLPVSSSIHASATIDTTLQRAKAGFALADKARGAAQDFEGEGPFGGGPAIGVWRSLLTDEYAKSFAKQGGIGIADQVYRSLIAAQEARAR